jgi:hypothetical protein
VTALLDPLVSLALSVRAATGGYALLLGSGVSRSAQIPTGWELMLGLIRRIAVAGGEDAGADPAAWYVSKHGRAPTYTEVLAHCGRTAPDRQRLLRSYFEPTGDEAARGVKVPTRAHRAIARLIRDGHVRVIVTTNFDRLMEKALEDVGIVPTVIQSPDGYRGAHPFQHNQCTILKVHGDYLDVRLRNIEGELATYPRPQVQALMRVFDEYGLVICGWSGEWDVALRGVLEGRRSRRYPLFWVTRGAPAPVAATLVAALKGDVIHTTGADDFFDLLCERLSALQRLDAAHPLSARLAVEAIKELSVDERSRIRLFDTVRDATEAARKGVAATADASARGGIPADAANTRRVLDEYEAALEVLSAVLATGVFWDSRRNDESRNLWVDPVSRLVGAVDGPQGSTYYLALSRYAVTYAGYCVGVAATLRRDYATLRRLFEIPIVADGHQTRLALYYYLANCCERLDSLGAMLGTRVILPLHARVHAKLRDVFRDLVPDDASFESAVARFEYLWGLYFHEARTVGADFVPPGMFWFATTVFSPPPLLAMMEKEVEQQGSAWEPVRAGLLPPKAVGDVAEYHKAILAKRDAFMYR